MLTERKWADWLNQNQNLEAPFSPGTHLVYDVSGLNVEQRGVVLRWILSQAGQAAAQQHLAEVMKNIAFDIAAAELSTVLNQYGHA